MLALLGIFLVGSQSLTEEPNYRQTVEKYAKCQFYTPNPIASSGIVAYVNR